MPVLAEQKAELQLPKSILGIPIPDSKLARDAAALSHSDSPLTLFNHCMRTYAFACVAADRMQWKYDHELAFVSSALHDLGLLKKYESKTKPFEEAGADKARDFARERGFPEEKSSLVWEGIKRHTTDGGQHPKYEVAMIMIGAGVDVLGSLRGGDLFEQMRRDSELKKKIDAIVKEFPREAFKIEFKKIMTAHARRVPAKARLWWAEDFVCDPKCGRGAKMLEESPWPE